MTLTFSSYHVLQRGSPAPGFALSGTDGKGHSLNEMDGKKAILVIFMCNHCPYVQPKMDYLVELQNRYQSAGFQIIAINSNDFKKYPDDSPAKMREWATNKKFNFPYLLDEDQQVAKAYGAVCTPDPFLFNSDRQLFYHGRIDEAHGKPHNEAKMADLEEAIKMLLGLKPMDTIATIPSMGCNIKWRD